MRLLLPLALLCAFLPASVSAEPEDRCWVFVGSVEAAVGCNDDSVSTGCLALGCESTVVSCVFPTESFLHVDCVGQPLRVDECVLYAHLADWEWRYVCVRSDAGCPVYHKRVVAWWETTACVAETPFEAGRACAYLFPEPELEDRRLCADPAGDPCVLYEERRAEGATTRTCLVP